MEEVTPKSILVTGGAGFLGSHLVTKLLDNGHHVTCVDDLSTGSLDNLTVHLNSDRFKLLEQCVTLPLNIQVDEIYNLACPASPKQYQTNPIQTMNTSILGATSVLNLAKDFNATVLQASTSEVYGDAQIHPQPENYYGNVNPIGLRSCYDEGKRAAESMFFDYKRQHDVSIKVSRIFNSYGPNMQLDDGRVVSNFIVSALKNMPLTVYGSGQQTRSFCYASDTINGLIAVMNSRAAFTGPVNIGNTTEISMLKLAETVIYLTNSKSQIEYVSLPTDDPNQRCPDISLAKTELNWEPKVSLEDGLLKTIDYFEEKLKQQ